MPWYDGLENMMSRNVSLATKTTFRIGGPADFFLTPANAVEFSRAYVAALRSSLPIFILGGGSNLLVSDNGIRGIVIRIPNGTSSKPKIHGDTITVSAGCPLNTLIKEAAKAGLAGFEALVGIPGTVGGALRINAGGRYGNIADQLSCVWLIDGLGNPRRFEADEIDWGYRRTSITQPISAAEFRLKRGDPETIHVRMAEILAEKISTQPMETHNAGCFFKNPPGDAAGRLIESAGLKGHRHGAARVSEKHANFIINEGGATAADVLALAGEVRDTVRDRFSKELEPEVRCWPLDGA